MDLELSGKVAVVTGASKGIGLAVTRALVDEGARVVAGRAQRPTSLEGLRGVTPVAVDLRGARRARRASSSARSTSTAASTCSSTTSARVRLRLDGFLGTSDEEFEWAMQMNFFTALRATRAAVASDGGAGRRARSSTSPRSTPSSSPTPATIDYGAAKAALVNLTKSLSQEFGPRGIRVNAVSPGPVSTDLWLGEHGVAETVAKATRRRRRHGPRRASSPSIGGFATGRFTTPEEVATLVVMLASARTGNVTGANYVIDGGLIKTT